MVTINLSYFTTGQNGTQVNWFKLVSDGGYSSECRIRTGDEDQRTVDLFLAFTNPSVVSANFLNQVREERRKKLEERLYAYNQARS